MALVGEFAAGAAWRPGARPRRHRSGCYRRHDRGRRVHSRRGGRTGRKGCRLNSQPNIGELEARSVGPTPTPAGNGRPPITGGEHTRRLVRQSSLPVRSRRRRRAEAGEGFGDDARRYNHTGDHQRHIQARQGAQQPADLSDAAQPATAVIDKHRDLPSNAGPGAFRTGHGRSRTTYTTGQALVPFTTQMRTLEVMCRRPSTASPRECSGCCVAPRSRSGRYLDCFRRRAHPSNYGALGVASYKDQRTGRGVSHFSEHPQIGLTPRGGPSGGRVPGQTSLSAAGSREIDPCPSGRSLGKANSGWLLWPLKPYYAAIRATELGGPPTSQCRVTCKPWLSDMRHRVLPSTVWLRECRGPRCRALVHSGPGGQFGRAAHQRGRFKLVDEVMSSRREKLRYREAVTELRRVLEPGEDPHRGVVLALGWTPDLTIDRRAFGTVGPGRSVCLFCAFVDY
jgi:hypothetical protein